MCIGRVQYHCANCVNFILGWVKSVSNCGEVARFFFGGRMIFCFFLCGEVAWVFVGRSCMMFLGGEVALFFSLTQSQGCVTFLWRGCVIFFEVTWFLLLRGCVICFWSFVIFLVERFCVFFCVERLRFVDRLHDFLSEEVVWFFH